MTKFPADTNSIDNVEFNSVVGGRTSYMQLTGSWFNYNYAHSYYIQSIKAKMTSHVNVVKRCYCREAQTCNN